MTEITYALLSSLLLVTTPDRPDITALSGQQQAIFEQVASEEFCGCQSSLSLSGCLDLRPNCRIANHLASWIVEQVEVGNDTNEILGQLAEQVMGPFCAKKHSINLEKLPFMGKSNAKVRIVEFADFRCPHCKTQAPIVKKLVQQLKGRAQFFFIPFPLHNHPQGLAAAEALFAADAQGKFWPMHDALFENQELGFDKSNLLRIAKKIGLKHQQFKKALDSHQYQDHVLALKRQGIQAGVMGTPSFLINGRLFSPNPSVMPLAKRLGMELDRNIGTCQ